MNTISISRSPIISANISKTSSSKKQFKNIKEQIKLKDNVQNFLIKAERVNGRSAMIGFTSAVLDEYVSGQSISHQFMDNIGISVATVGLVILGTASNPKDEGKLDGGFSREAETVNGRLAMIGVMSLLLSESIHPQIPIF